jgi:hypothetical protein
MAKSEESWFQKAAELVVRENMPFRAAAHEAGAEITTVEAENIFRRKSFQKLLWTERNKYYAEVANEPGRNKTSAVGLMHLLVHKLIEAGEFDKALEGITKLAKLEGWLNPETQINIMGELTGKDLAKLRKDLEKEKLDREATASANRTSPPSTVN